MLVYKPMLVIIVYSIYNANLPVYLNALDQNYYDYFSLNYNILE